MISHHDWNSCRLSSHFSRFLFNLVISNHIKLNESKTLSLYKSMVFSNKLKLKKNKRYLDFVGANSLALNSSESFSNFFFNNLSRKNDLNAALYQSNPAFWQRALPPAGNFVTKGSCCFAYISFC